MLLYQAIWSVLTGSLREGLETENYDTPRF